MRALHLIHAAALALGLGGLTAVPQPPDPSPKAAPAFAGDDSAKYVATVRVTGLAPTDLVFFDVLPGDEVEYYESPCENSISFGGPPGTYTVKARGTVGGKKFSLVKKVTLFGGPQPPGPPGPPNPPDPPGPPKPPAPTGKVTKFVVVEDTTKAGPWRGDVLGSPKVKAWYSAAGMRHRLVDVNNPENAGDPAAAYFAKAAAGKTLPYLWQLDATGAVVRDGPCPTEPDAFVAAFGPPSTERSLGCVREAPDGRKWKKFGASPSVPLIPRAQWKPVDLSAFLPPVHDQDGRGQCVASSSCTVIESCRAQAGLPYQYLSAGDLYSRINGGRDNGSTLDASMAEVMAAGVTTADKVPYVWDGRKHADPGDRASYKVTEVYLCESFDAAASALQQGFFLEEALDWYSGYTPGPDGWVNGPSGRVVGGHALAGYGLASKGGAWGIMTRNSWGTSWGGSSDGTVGAGNCVLAEKCFKGDFQGFFAVRAVTQTPTPFPVPRSSAPDRSRFPYRTLPPGFALAP